MGIFGFTRTVWRLFHFEEKLWELLLKVNRLRKQHVCYLKRHGAFVRKNKNSHEEIATARWGSRAASLNSQPRSFILTPYAPPMLHLLAKDCMFVDQSLDIRIG